MNHKKVITIFIILGIIFTVLGGTLAYWSWSSTANQSTAVTFTVTAGMSCSADGGGNITNEVMLAPAKCTDTNYALIRPVTVSTTTQVTDEIINVSMNLHIDSVSQELLDSDNFKYALTSSSNSCDDPIQGGSFNDMLDTTTSTVPLLINEEFVGNQTKTYYLYIWLDEAETSLSTMNKSFSMSLTGECTDSGNAMKKYYAYFGSELAYYKNIAYRRNITSISFVNNIDIPANALNQWDVGVSPSNAEDVKVWLEDAGTGNNKFALKIGANGTIFANDLSYSFCYLYNVSNFDFTALNTSETTNMTAMLASTGLDTTDFNLNLGNQIDTSKVTSMRNMFSRVGQNAMNFNLDLGTKFDTSKVTDMIYMFDYVGTNATNWNLNLGDKFDTRNVTGMTNMFHNAGTNATNFNLNLGNKFNTINVTSMYSMFHNVGANSTNFTLNLGNNFNTSNVITMANMFSAIGRNSSNFSLDLGNNFDTSNATSMSYMFSGAGKTSNNWNLDLGNKFNTSKAIDMSYMFSGIGTNVENGVLDLGSKFNTTNVTNMAWMFSGLGGNSTNFTLNIGNHFDTSNVIDMAAMFNFSFREVTNFNLNLGEHFNTINVKNMVWMFSNVGRNSTNFSLNLGNNFDTSNVNNMSTMFYNTGYNVSNFSLNLGSHFDMSNVVQMPWMFQNMANKTTTGFNLDLSAGNFAKVTNNAAMFYGVPANKVTIYVKDATAQNFIIAQNTNFSASNVLIK